MLGTLKGFFGKKENITASDSETYEPKPSSNPNFLTDPKKIRCLLKNIEEAAPICTITIEGTNDSFSTSILDVQLENNQIILDELSPSHGNELVISKKAFKLSTIYNGIHLAFKVNNIETGRSREIVYYKVAIPNRIYYPQRRSSPRIQITVLHIPFSGISERTKATVGGSIFDISRKGLSLGISITNNIARLQRGDTLKNCRITFEGRMISFDLSVRFVKTSNISTARTIIGGYFENLSSKSRNKLERFVATLEREEIRNRRE